MFTSADLEFGSEDEDAEDNWAEVDDSEFDNAPENFIEVAADGIKLKKASIKKPIKTASKGKISSMKVASKAKVAAAKQKMNKTVSAKKAKAEKRKAVVSTRKAEISKRVRAQKNATTMKKTRMVANRKADMKHKAQLQ